MGESAIRNPQSAIRLALMVGMLFVPPDQLGAASAYDQIIAPIFRARCVECHGEKKQKAKLALHSWEALNQGSDAGPVMVAGKPAESPLLQRMRLPADDEEHMPPTDKAQPSADELALLTRWIETGASPTAPIGDLNLPGALAGAAEALPAKLAAIVAAQAQAEPIWEIDPAAVTKLRAALAAKVAALQRLFPGALSYESRTSAALHFTAAGLGLNFGDTEFAELVTVAGEVVTLDLSRSAITDQSAPMLAQFEKVRVLRAGFTRVGDVTVQALGSLPALESLSLPETKISATSVGVLKDISPLRALRLGGTAAEAAAQAAGLPVIARAPEMPPAAGQPAAETPPP